MKTKYTKPAIEAVLIKCKQMLLAGSPDGWEPFVIDINELTGIHNSEWSMVNGHWYSLQGVNLGTNRPTATRVYLYNGQKVVIRNKKE
jgi:hypothetical protein